MTREEQLEIIRAACVAANPDKFGTVDEPETFVRLADVLLAITTHSGNTLTSLMFSPYGGFLDKDGPFGEVSTVATWNLRADDLTQQSDECITFLADLLAHTK